MPEPPASEASEPAAPPGPDAPGAPDAQLSPDPQAAGEPDGGAGHRLERAAIPVWFLYDTGRLILALIPLIILGGGISTPLLGLLLFMLIGPAVRYQRFRYYLQETTLVVEGGLLQRWRRVIPKERIQSVDIVEKLRHRAFGVVEVRVETVGGSQTEAALVAVRPEEAERVRYWALGTGHHAEETEPAPALARLTPGRLVLAGITGGRVAVLAVLIGYAQQFVGPDSFEIIGEVAEGFLPRASLWMIAALLVGAVVAVSLLLSIALTVLIYWDHTVRLERDRLVITRGLLDRRRAQIPLRRIQAIQVEQNLARRPFGLASLTVVVAGYSSEGQEGQQSSLLLPIAGRDQAWQVATRILGAAPELARVPLPRTPARSILRRAAVPTLLAAGIGVAAAWQLDIPPSYAVLLIPATWIAAWLGWRARGHALADGYVLIRSGILVHRTTIIPEPKIQHLQLTWSPLQLGLDLATVQVNIPGTGRRALDLDRRQAQRWFRWLGDRSTVR